VISELQKAMTEKASLSLAKTKFQAKGFIQSKVITTKKQTI